MTLNKRLESLERQTPEESASAMQIYTALCSLGVTAPEPLDGQTGRDYLKCVPFHSLKVLRANLTSPTTHT